MPNVVSAVTEQHVHAGEVLLGTPSQSAENVRFVLITSLPRTVFDETSFSQLDVDQMMNVLSQRLVLIENARTLASTKSVAKMLYAV